MWVLIKIALTALGRNGMRTALTTTRSRSARKPPGNWG